MAQQAKRLWLLRMVHLIWGWIFSHSIWAPMMRLIDGVQGFQLNEKAHRGEKQLALRLEGQEATLYIQVWALASMHEFGQFARLSNSVANITIDANYTHHVLVCICLRGFPKGGEKNLGDSGENGSSPGRSCGSVQLQKSQFQVRHPCHPAQLDQRKMAVAWAVVLLHPSHPSTSPGRIKRLSCRTDVPIKNPPRPLQIFCRRCILRLLCSSGEYYGGQQWYLGSQVDTRAQ